MGRTYAGILGYLAVTLALARGVWTGIDPELIFNHVLIVLVVFTPIGFVLGQIAQATIDEAVRAKLEIELAISSASAAPRTAKEVA